MMKLIYIKGSWNIDCYEGFSSQYMFQGQILLQEDGWFEGIVVDSNSTNKEEKLVFGAYFPEKVIRLFYLTPLKAFDGTKYDDEYVGEWSTIGLFGARRFGSSQIVTKETPEIKQDMEENMQKLATKIQNYKNAMDQTSKDFYDNTIAIRITLTQSILRRYEGRGFTKAEIEELRKEFEPVNERVIQSNKNAVRKLVKNMADDTWDDEEDLPF